MPDDYRADISSDLLRPIGTDNRDEYILVEFHRCLKNTNMSILHNLAAAVKTEPFLAELFPALKDFVGMSKDVRYAMSSMYNRHWEFLRMMLKDNEGRLSEDLLKRYAETYLYPLHLNYLHTTRLEVVLHQLSLQDFVKHIYITAPKFTDEMKSYLVALFGADTVDKKIVCLENDPKDVLLELPDITTAFLSNSDDVLEVVERNRDCLTGKYIVVVEGYGNLLPAKENQMSHFIHVGDDVFRKLQEQRICVVAHMYPYFTPIDPITNERTDSKP